MKMTLGRDNLNDAAYKAIEDLWAQTVKARALCPYQDMSAVGTSGYNSPPWYQQRGATFFVNQATKLTPSDVQELLQIARSINCSFVVSMASVLETHDIVRSGDPPDRNKEGGDHAQLTKWLR